MWIYAIQGTLFLLIEIEVLVDYIPIVFLQVKM